MKIEIRKPYDGKRIRQAIHFLDDDGKQALGRTKQAHKDETDINKILHQYDKTGLITHVNRAAGEYGDFTEINEYQESLNIVIKAQQSFDELPSMIRKKFGNDPGNFLEFITDPKNKDEMVELGLAKAPQVVDIPSNNDDKSPPKTAE